MNIIQCNTCHHYFEEEDVQKVEHKTLCYGCVTHCKNCNCPYIYPDGLDYCYHCLEGNFV